MWLKPSHWTKWTLRNMNFYCQTGSLIVLIAHAGMPPDAVSYACIMWLQICKNSALYKMRSNKINTDTALTYCPLKWNRMFMRLIKNLVARKQERMSCNFYCKREEPKQLTGKRENSFQEPMWCRGLMLEQQLLHPKHGMPHSLLGRVSSPEFLGWSQI